MSWGSGLLVEFLVDRLVAGERGKTRKIEGGTGSGGVGSTDGSRADTAGTKTSEEGSTVALLGYCHRDGMGERARDVWWSNL